MPHDHILIADDEPNIVAQLKEVFTTNGYRTVCAGNALQAWGELFNCHPDDFGACVIDLQMPPGSFGGKDLVLKIRRGYSTRLPVVIYSGRGTISSSHEVTLAGANAFIEKEAGVQQVVDVVTKLIAENAVQATTATTSVSQLARNSDLPSIAWKALRILEDVVRTQILTQYTPESLTTTLEKKKQKLPIHVEGKVAKLSSFSDEKVLGLGDLLDILAALSASQLQQLPAVSLVRRLCGQIVPVRNALFHGRPVTDKELLIAIMSCDDLKDGIERLG